MRKFNFMHGSFMVATINVIIGLIGFIYNIQLSKLIGPKGIGLFQMASAVLMMFLFITTAGIPSAVSRLVAEQNSKHNPYAVKRIFRTAVTFTLLLSVGLSFALIAFAGDISQYLFKNQDLQPCLYMLSPAIVAISTTSVMRGYYYGMNMMGTASASEIIENLARLFIIIGLLTFVKPTKPIHGALIAIFGISIGEVFDLFWLMLIKRRNSEQLSGFEPSSIRSSVILGSIIDIAGPLTITGLSNTIMQSANTILIPQRLMASSFPHAAIFFLATSGFRA